MIQNISIEKLHPHPDNPRKDLGDLSELVESIKANGVLQNLTVVELDKYEAGYYRIVIGHRRFEAAKQAGLTELPCAISTMDYKTQVGTMLLENMQRADLSIYEQAQGFQMMLNLGDTVNDIAEQTGFSSTTVRRRVKLLELDPEKFKASAERNVTLMDYAELEKIEDIALRNKVLDSIGTQNFKYELQKAVDKEKSDKNMAIYVEKLNTFATQTENSSGMRYITSYYLSRNDEVKTPEDAGTVKYYYVISNYGYITLYAEAIETQEDTAAKEKRELQKARYNALDEITKRAFDLRNEFVKSISNAKAKKNILTIIEYAIRDMLESYNSRDVEDLAEMLGIPIEEDDEREDEFGFEDIAEGLRQQPERYLLIATYCGLDSKSDRYYNWDCSYLESEDLDRTYAFLESLGYEISDEEQALRDGTHELFKREEGE